MKTRFLKPKWFLLALAGCFAPLSAWSQTINITSAPYNASTGSGDNAAAIQAAINAVGSGGTVLVPSGTFLSGPITLKSNMTLQLAAGSILRMTAFGTFPQNTSFVYGTGLTNITINGSGTMDGQGAAWWTDFNNGNPDNRPPAMIYLSKGKGETITGITVKDSPKFHVQLLGTGSNIYVGGVSITAAWPSPNTDGIDLRGSNVLIENSYISDGDDMIQLGGTDPTSGVTIQNCTFGTGHGLSIGGYTQGGVSNLLVNNCTFTGSQYGIRWKTGRDRGGTMNNLTYSNITMTGILLYPFFLTSFYPNPSSLPPTTDDTQAITSTTPFWNNITLSHITASTAASGAKSPGIMWAVTEAPMTNIVLDAVTVTGPSGVNFEFHHARGVTIMCNCRVDGQQPPTNVGAFDATITYPPCGSTPTFTRTNTPANTMTRTNTPTATISNTATRTSTNSPTRTATPSTTPSPTPTRTATATPSRTPTATSTNTVGNTATNTPSRTPSNTPTNTATATATRTATNSSTPTSSNTASRTPTATSTNTAGNTMTASNTPTLSPTKTPSSTPSNTPSLTSSNTPTNSRTNTPANTATKTPTPSPTATAINTNTMTPTNTGTAQPSATASRTPTNSPTPTGTDTVTDSPTKTSTATPSNTASWTPSPTLTNTATNSSTRTDTATPSATFTNSASSTATNTAVNTNTPTPTSTGTTPPTSTATTTPSNSPTKTATNTLTSTPTGTATNSPTLTGTRTATASPTNTPVATLTPTNSPTNTPTAVNTNTATRTPTNSPTRTHTPSFTPTASFTGTSTVKPTASATGTFTATSTSTSGPKGKPTPILYPNPSDGGPVSLLPPPYNGLSDVNVKIFTTAFRKVVERTFSSIPPGTAVTLTLTDKWGRPLASGIYYVVVTSNAGRSVGKLIVLR